MHVAQIGFFVDPQQRSPSQLLRDWSAMSDIAAAVASAGVRVTVIQACKETETLERAGIAYHFIKASRSSEPLARDPVFKELVSALSPDIFHVHGLGFPSEVFGLQMGMSTVPIFVQDHADKVPNYWKRSRWRRSAPAIAGVSFCARAQAEPFLRAGVLQSGVKIFEIPESTSRFLPGEGARAREITGVSGNPAVLWVGHLDRNKDPLAVLRGISAAAPKLPDLQLWCCYGKAPLLRSVTRLISRDPNLSGRVHLLGHVPHEQIEYLMRSADLFVLGSHREGSCFSVIEALATGLTPVVTDIPSLRALTGNGEVGHLWPCGDWQALANVLPLAAASVGRETQAAVRAHFDIKLSSVALGRQFSTAYRHILDDHAARPRDVIGGRHV